MSRNIAALFALNRSTLVLSHPFLQTLSGCSPFCPLCRLMLPWLFLKLSRSCALFCMLKNVVVRFNSFLSWKENGKRCQWLNLAGLDLGEGNTSSRNAAVRPALYVDLQSLQVQFVLAQYLRAKIARKIVQFLISSQFCSCKRNEARVWKYLQGACYHWTDDLVEQFISEFQENESVWNTKC